MKKLSIIFSILFGLSLILTSCDDSSKSGQSQYEAWNSGELKVYYDNELSPMLDTVFVMYKKAMPNVKATFIPVTSREGMALLLNGKAKVVLQSRGFLRDEDSLRKLYNVEIPEPWEFAIDGLVFFTSSDNTTIDTMNTKNIEEYFKDYNVSSKYGLNFEGNPEIVLPEINSGIYANFKTLVLKNQKTQRKLITFSTVDSVKNYVASNHKSIGIAYLSNIIGDIRFKPIPLGYYDSTNHYVNPKPVHQAYFVQGFYPYLIKHKAFLFEDRKNLALWFATFISKESYIQKYFKDYGIVPAYAKFVLIQNQ